MERNQPLDSLPQTPELSRREILLQTIAGVTAFGIGTVSGAEGGKELKDRKGIKDGKDGRSEKESEEDVQLLANSLDEWQAVDGRKTRNNLFLQAIHDELRAISSAYDDCDTARERTHCHRRLYAFMRKTAAKTVFPFPIKTMRYMENDLNKEMYYYACTFLQDHSFQRCSWKFLPGKVSPDLPLRELKRQKFGQEILIKEGTLKHLTQQDPMEIKQGENDIADVIERLCNTEGVAFDFGPGVIQEKGRPEAQGIVFPHRRIIVCVPEPGTADITCKAEKYNGKHVLIVKGSLAKRCRSSGNLLTCKQGVKNPSPSDMKRLDTWDSNTVLQNAKTLQLTKWNPVKKTWELVQDEKLQVKYASNAKQCIVEDCRSIIQLDALLKYYEQLPK